MERSENERIAAYYDSLAAKYGHSFRAADARSTESLLIRYKVLSEVMDLTGRSVLEVGCGFGDLGIFLQREYRDIRYLGIDISATMIAKGRAVHEKLNLRQMSVLDMQGAGKFDVVLANGIFYKLRKRPRTTTQKLIRKMFELCKEAAAFTAISTWATRKSGTEFRVNPVWLVQYCSLMTPYVVMRHDYHGGDVAIYVYKRPQNEIEDVHLWPDELVSDKGADVP